MNLLVRRQLALSAFCLSFSAALSSSSAQAEERPPVQFVGRGALGYGSDPLSSAPAYRLSFASLLGVRFHSFVLGVEGAYFTGTKVEGIPPVLGGSEDPGRLTTLRLSLIGQYEFRLDAVRLAPLLGAGIERTSFVHGNWRGESSQPVLFQGVVLAYEFTPSFALVLDQRLQEISFDQEWGFAYWGQLGAEFSFW